MRAGEVRPARAPGLLTRTRLPPHGGSSVGKRERWCGLPVTDPGVSLGPSRPLLSSGPCSAAPAGSRQPSIPPPRPLLPHLGCFSLCCWVLRGPDPATCCCCRPPCLTRSCLWGAGSQGSPSGSLWSRVWRSGGFWASADRPHQALRVGSAQCSAGKGGLHRQQRPGRLRRPPAAS